MTLDYIIFSCCIGVYAVVFFEEYVIGLQHFLEYCHQWFLVHYHTDHVGKTVVKMSRPCRMPNASLSMLL